MTEFSEYLHFIIIAFTVAINAIGVGIGQGLTSAAAIEGINQQPAARNEINKTAILSMALIETAAVMGTFISLLLLLKTKNSCNSFYGNLAEIGIAFAICCSGFVLGIVSAFPARAACFAIARQPFFRPQIITIYDDIIIIITNSHHFWIYHCIVYSKSISFD